MIATYFHWALFAWINTDYLEDYGYTEWLGPGYKEKQVLPLKVSTWIGAPHSSWLDTAMPQYVEDHAFAVKKETKQVPLLRDMFSQMQCIYIDRTAGQEAVDQILARQAAIEKDPREPPMFILPEGT